MLEHFTRSLQGKIMKTIVRSIVVVGAVLFLPAVGMCAADLSKWYLTGDVGGVFQQDTTFSQSTSPGVKTPGTFNPGIRGDIAVGYNLNKSFAVELESGVLWNSIDKFGGVTLSQASQSLDFYSIPVLAKVVYKVPTGNAWTPYFGVGAGGVIGMADFQNTAGHSSDTTFIFAYQAEAGLDYALTKNTSVGIAYKFLSTPTQRYYLNGPGINDHITLTGIYTHAIVASFTWKF